jgi:p-aminobenzoyl-glutamate transporter AbgT
MLQLAKNYNKVDNYLKPHCSVNYFLFCILYFAKTCYKHFQALEDEDKMTPEQLAIKNVGKQVTLQWIMFAFNKFCDIFN